MRTRMLPLILVGAVPLGCSTVPTPQTQAVEVERVQCEGAPDSRDLRVLEAATVIKAEPLYSHVVTGKSFGEERVDGAKLLIRPPEGISAERMSRLIQCHSAQALLGRVDRTQFPDDPFWLPDTWITVEVTPEHGNYAVTLEANDLPSNLRLAQRAQAYAQARALVVR